MGKTNNYIRNNRGAFFFFDDRSVMDIARANEHAKEMKDGTDKHSRVVAWKPAPGLYVDGLVGVAPVLPKSAEGLLS